MIHVVIERQVAEGMLSTYEQLLKTALQRTFIVHGFISGEAFHDTEDENHRVLICKWRSEKDWHRWSQSEERKNLLSAMAPILAKDEKVTVLLN